MGVKEHLENKVNNITRRIVKTLTRPLKIALIIIILVAIVIVFLAANFDAVADAFSKKVSTAVQENRIEYVNDNGEKINYIDIKDKDVEKLVKAMEEAQISIDKLKLTKDDLKKIYAAELVTTEVNRVKENEQEEKDKHYGRVYVKRANGVNENLEPIYKKMNYVELSELEGKVEEYKKCTDKESEEKLREEILAYFAIENDEICFVDYTSCYENELGEITTDASIKKVSYKDKISQFIVPVEFLLDMCFISQNPNFILDLSDKIIKETEINLAILPSTGKTNTINTYKYQEEQLVNTKVIVYGKTTTSYETTSGPNILPSEGEYNEEITETNLTTVSSELRPESAKTWFMNLKYQYTELNTEEKIVIPETDPSNIMEDEEWPPFSSSYSQTSENGIITQTITSVSTRRVNQTKKQDITIKTKTYQSSPTPEREDKTDDIVKMIRTKYKIPNSSLKIAPLENLDSGSEMFFEMLKNGERTQDLEQLMRYILGKALDKDFGFSDFDFSIFDIGEFTTIGGIYGSSVEDKFWYVLKNLNYSDEAIAGAMGNISCESGFNTSALNSSSGAYGLAQWLGGRRENLQAYATSKGTTEVDVDTQIEFLVAEITGTGNAVGFATRRTAGGKGENYHTYDDWKNATNIEEAAVAYCWFYETPSTASEKTSSIIATENKRIEAAKKYYNMYKDRGTGGQTTNSNASQVKCYYTASNGRKYTIINQYKINYWWEDKCNRAASAIIVSGHCNETPTELINNAYTMWQRNNSTPIPPMGMGYWEKYGLNMTWASTNNYEQQIKNQLTSGNYAMIRVDGTYYGKSGTKWTSSGHWVAIIDYKMENNVFKMAIADYRGITWVDSDEFNKGIQYLVLVNQN